MWIWHYSLLFVSLFLVRIIFSSLDNRTNFVMLLPQHCVAVRLLECLNAHNAHPITLKFLCSKSNDDCDNTNLTLQNSEPTRLNPRSDAPSPPISLASMSDNAIIRTLALLTRTPLHLAPWTMRVKEKNLLLKKYW